MLNRIDAFLETLAAICFACIPVAMMLVIVAYRARGH